jgi:hypothetical protein
MSSETQTQNRQNYGLSSWNYGSFHSTNPYYAPSHKPQNDNQQNLQRCQSASSFNKYGKRKLREDEKIVTDEYLKVMRDNKTINSSNGVLPHRRPSSTIKIVRVSETDDDNNNNDSSMRRRDSINSQTGLQTIAKKNLKYQLTFEEWAIMKNKQDEIYKRVKEIKESEDKKFEKFNKKIEENYEKVK